MVKVSRTQSSPPASQSRRAHDIGGLFLFFAGAASLICLSVNNPTAPVTGMVDGGLRLLAGLGAYAMPLLLMFIGTMFLIGYERLSLSHSSLGTMLLGLVFVTWEHLARVPFGPVWNKMPMDVQQAAIKNAGGVIGWLFGTALRATVGGPIAYLFLITLSLVALVLLVDQPFIVILRRIHEQSRVGMQSAQAIRAGTKSIGAAANARALPAGNGNGANSAKALQPAVAGASASGALVTAGSDRTARAERVAERALSGKPGNGQTATLPFDEEDENNDAAPDDSPDTVFSPVQPVPVVAHR